MYSNKDLAIFFKALSDETRLKIVLMLKNENLCACHILDEFSITQPTLSYHMKILVDSGLVKGDKDGNWTRYQLNKDVIEKMNDFFKEIENSNESISREIAGC